MRQTSAERRAMIAAWASDEEDNKGGHDAQNQNQNQNQNLNSGEKKEGQIVAQEADPENFHGKNKMSNSVGEQI